MKNWATKKQHQLTGADKRERDNCDAIAFDAAVDSDLRRMTTQRRRAFRQHDSRWRALDRRRNATTQRQVSTQLIGRQSIVVDAVCVIKQRCYKNVNKNIVHN